MQIRLIPLTLLAGIAAGVFTVAIYQWWWGLALAGVTALLLLLAAPPGWGTRLPFGLGFALSVILLSLNRGEGDYLVLADAKGYVVLGFAMVAMIVSAATLPRPARRPRSPSLP